MSQSQGSSRHAAGDLLTARRFDLLVIGGGITGAGVARDAAMRGLATVLVDRGDFGAGTSSRSSRLIHGGLRYLEQFQWRLVAEALRERRVLLRIAPHLVRRLPFVLPSFRGDRVPRWKLAAGLGLYGLLTTGGNVPRPRMLGKAGMLALEPNLRTRGLRGGGLYYDAQCDDARLVLATIRSAAASGAVVANHVEVTALWTDGDRVAGADVRDRLTGEHSRIRARAVVNATGPWTDRIRRMEDPHATSLLRTTKGAHVMVPRVRLGHTHGITFTSPIDGRVMFILPWADLSYIGTTDTDAPADPDQATVEPPDIQYLLRSANALFPHAHLAEDDVIASWAGLRPLLAGDPTLPESAVSREHRVLRGPLGMITVAGGKLTTYRSMARETVDAAVTRLGGREALRQWPHPPTDTEPLVGGETPSFEPFLHQALETGLPTGTAEHLVRLYGTETAAVLNLVREDRRLGTRVHPRHVAIAAEVVHAVDRDLARTPDDVLDRRLHLTTETADQGEAARAEVERLMREAGAGN